MLQKIKHNTFYKAAVEIFRRYFAHTVSRSAAEFAYFSLFSFFPLLIFLNSLIGFLNINLGDIREIFDNVIPNEVLNIVIDYTSYLSSLKSTGLMFTGIFLTIYFFTRAVNALMYAMNRAYKIIRRRHAFIQWLISALVTILLLVIVIVSLLLIVFGKTFLLYIDQFIPIQLRFINAWHIIRFVIIALLTLFFLTFVYMVSPNRKIKLRQALPGTLCAMFGWLAASIGFSFYVENAARYSLLYGSLGAVIVLMLWLYITGIVLIMGCEFNNVIEECRRSDLPSDDFHP